METALAAHGKRGVKKGAGKGKKPAKSGKSKSDEKCNNCGKAGHKKPDCWSKGGKKGQGPRQKKKLTKTEMVTVAADMEDDNMFTFACTSDYAVVTETLQLPKSRLGTCVNSGATQVYSPDHLKFSNYKLIDQNITIADGRLVKAVGVGDSELELPNGSKRTNIVFKRAVYAPGLAFTYISISRLDKNPKEHAVATIPHSKGLYRITMAKETSTGDHANVASVKLYQRSTSKLLVCLLFSFHVSW